jgi:serine/threonine protein kinase
MNNAVKKQQVVENLNIRVGSCIDGRFEILDKLDDTRVFLVRDIQVPDRLFALKLCSRDDIFTQEFNLRREYIIHSHIDHSSVVKVYEPFETDVLFGFLMDYMGGGDLHDFITKKGPACVYEGLSILRSILEGLSEIHSKNIVHADIKPENILLTSSEKPKITDFGVAREILNRFSFDSSVKGTIKYLCPQYIKTGKIDPTIDVFAAGLIAFELFSGTVPFEFNSTIEMVRMRLSSDMPSLGEYLPKDKYSQLIDAVDKAIRRNPEDRFRNAGDFLNALPERYYEPKDTLDPSLKLYIKGKRLNFLKNKTSQLMKFA